MPNKTATLDAVFHALADPTRRSVLSRLCAPIRRGPLEAATAGLPSTKKNDA